MPQIDITADAAQAVTGVNQYTSALGQMNVRLKEVTSTFAKFNADGEQTGAVLKGLTAAGDKFVSTFKALKDKQGNLIFNDDATAKLGLVSVSYQKVAENANKASDAAKKAQDQINKATEALKAARGADPFDKAATSATGLAGIMNRVQRSFQYFVAYRAFNFIADQLNEGTAAANKLQIQLSLIRTISQDNQYSFSNIGEQVRNVSDKSGFDINKTAKAFYDTISNQVAKGSAVAPFVQEAADLARVTGSELPDAVNTLTSVINAYGKSAGDAANISAVLFRTVDDGRIVLSETANTMGRVLVIANQLGVSFTDVQATLAITTQKGFKTSDAMTLLTNLLVKLEKPTEATKKLFESLGVESGEQAIQIYSFTGVIQKIIDLTSAGIVPVSAFFDEIRGRKQFGVLQQSLGDIQKLSASYGDLAKNAQLYNNAKTIRGESDADKLNKTLNQVGNYFKQDIGNQIISYSNSILELGKSARDTAESLGVLPGASSAVNASLTILTGVGIAGAVGGVKTLTTGLRANAVAFLSARTAMLAWGGVLFAAVETGRLLGTILGRSQIKIEGPTLEQVQGIQNAAQEYRQKQQPSPAQGQKPLDFINEQTTSQILGFYAQITIANNKLLDSIKGKSKEASDALVASFSSFSGALQNRISTLQEAVSKANSEIHKSLQSTQKFTETADQLLYGLQEKYAESSLGGFNNQQIQLTEQRIAQLHDKIVGLYKGGTSEGVAEARRIINNEYLPLLIKSEEQTQEVAGKFFAESVKNNPLATNPLGQTDAYGNPVAVRTVNFDPVKARVKGAAAEFTDLEAKYQAAQKQTIANDSRQVEQEKLRLKLFNEAVAARAKLSPTNEKGDINEQFKDKYGNFDAAKYNKLIADSDARISRLANANIGGPDFLTKSGADPRIALEEALKNAQKARILEVSALERKVYLENLKANAQNAQEQFKAQVEQQQQIQTKSSAKTESSLKSISDLLAGGAAYQQAIDQASQFQVRNPATGGYFATGAHKSTTGGTSGTILPLLQQTEDLRQQAIAANDKLKNGPKDAAGNLILNPADVLAAKRALDAYTASYAALGKKLQELNGGNATQPKIGGITTNEFLGILDSKSKDLLGAQYESAGAQTTIDALKKGNAQSTVGTLGELQKAFPDIAIAAQEAASKTTTAFSKAADEGINKLIDRVKQLKLELKTIPTGDNKQSSNVIDVGEGFGFPEPAYAATGGIVGQFPGQPRGVDRYPIWAAAGEVIVDAATASMYRPQLDAIMKRRMPRSGISAVMNTNSTTIRDINVTVQGATTNSETGRAVSNELARAFRRRLIKPIA